MFLHFEDWSVFLSKLEAKGVPHGDHIIKVFATHEDPREVFALSSTRKKGCCLKPTSTRKDLSTFPGLIRKRKCCKHSLSFFLVS